MVHVAADLNADNPIRLSALVGPPRLQAASAPDVPVLCRAPYYRAAITSREHHTLGRSAAASGICFCVLFIGGIVPLGELLGSFADSDETFEIYFASSSNRTGNIIGGVLLGISAFVFLWFLQHLRHHLQPTEMRAATLPSFVFSSGQAFVTLLLAGTAALVTVPVTLAVATLFDDRPLATGQAILPQFGYVMLALFANWAAAAMVLAATVSARRTGAFPRWLCRLGFVVTTLLILFGLSGGGAFFALPAWTLAVSVHWWRSPQPGGTAPSGSRGLSSAGPALGG